MKRRIAIYILLLSLFGLMVVQFRLLVIGVRLEKQRFDQRVRIGLQEMNGALEKEFLLADELGKLLVAGVNQEEIRGRKSFESVLGRMDTLLTQKLGEKGITARFTYAITDRYGTEMFVASKNFVPKSFHFYYYNVLLGNRVTAQAHGERVLHLDIANLFNYLLGELNYLIIPSLLFLAALLICLWFLVNMLRKEERLNEVKNEFINNLTHELKTPVFSISLASKILKEHIENRNFDKADQFLAMIGHENEKLKTHIDKVLELATLENPAYQLTLENANLNDLVAEVAGAFRMKVVAAKGQLNLQLSAQPLTVKLDAVHFKNVIQNLLENALKYSPEKIDITVKTQCVNNYIELIISDLGIGISSEHQAKIFEKFYRIPTQNLHAIKGFGLGLHYVKQIVERHGGIITVSSRPEKGTHFLIKLSPII